MNEYYVDDSKKDPDGRRRLLEKRMHGDIIIRMRLAYPGVQCEAHLNSPRVGELTPTAGVHEFRAR